MFRWQSWSWGGWVSVLLTHTVLSDTRNNCPYIGSKLWGRNLRGAVILTPVVSSPFLLLSFPLEMCPPPPFCWGAHKVGQLCRQPGASFTLFSLQIPLCKHSVFIHSSSRYKGTQVPSICTKDCAGSSRATECTQLAPLLCNFYLLWSGEPGVVISKTSSISGLTRETLTSHSFLSSAAGGCTTCACGIESRRPPHNSSLQEVEETAGQLYIGILHKAYLKFGVPSDNNGLANLIFTWIKEEKRNS